MQKDITLLKEKDYVKNPKKSGYQSIHLIVGVPVTYLEKDKGNKGGDTDPFFCHGLLGRA